MCASRSSPPARTIRLGLRATQNQRAVLCRAAEVVHKSVAEFILDSACLAAEQTLLEQRAFTVDGERRQSLLDLLDRPEQPNEGLRDLFSRRAPWTSA